MKELTLDEIIVGIKGGRIDLEKIIRKLHDNESLRSGIRLLIYKNKTSELEFDELLNKTLMSFIKTIFKNPDLKIKSSVVAYLLGIARYQLIGNLRAKSKNPHLEELPQHYELPQISNPSPEKIILISERSEIFKKVLHQISPTCKEVLMYWSGGYSMQEIAKLMKYKSEGYARKKKCECQKSLLRYFEKNPHIAHLLKDE